MAANTEHKCFPQPDSTEAAIWRYMDVPKLLSLLVNRSLFFPLVEILDDPKEGSATWNQSLAAWEKAQKIYNSDEKIVGRLESSTELVRKSVFVNSWCMQEDESNALWRIYGQNNNGVAICSRYKKLVDSLTPLDHVGMINYINYGDDEFETNNLMNYIMHKRREFSYEHEVRVVRWHRVPAKSDDQEVISAFNQTVHVEKGGKIVGLNVPIDIESLIDGIIISPYAERWLPKTVDKLVASLGLNISIEDSIMRGTPTIEHVPMTEAHQNVIQNAMTKGMPVDHLQQINVEKLPE